MKAIWNGAILAESDNTVVVEGNHYFPADSIKKAAMRKTSDFENGTNNYVWINPANPISWDFR